MPVHPPDRGYSKRFHRQYSQSELQAKDASTRFHQDDEILVCAFVAPRALHRKGSIPSVEDSSPPATPQLEDFGHYGQIPRVPSSVDQVCPRLNVRKVDAPDREPRRWLQPGPR